MIYTTKLLFEEIRPQWADIAQEVPKKNMRIGVPKKEAERGFEAYENAFLASLPIMILGDEKIRADETLIQNVGTLATDPQINQKKIREFLATNLQLENNRKALATAVKVHTTQGAILNDSHWWPFQNDMFMLGAIHSKKEFHLASLNGIAPTDDLLWDKTNKRPRVLGRELIMLALAGYKMVEAPSFSKRSGSSRQIHLEQAFYLPDAKQAQAATLTLTVCREKFAEITSAEDIRNLFVDSQ